MINLSPAEGPVQRFGLVPETRVTRRAMIDPGKAPTSAFIEITQPLVTPVTKALVAGDPELAAFWEAEKRSFRYDYVMFRCTLIPAEGMPFEKAWLEVQLAPEAADKGPIAYSMAPDKIVDVKSLKDTAKIGADLKFLKAAMGTEEGREVGEYVLRAWREQSATPYWSFNKTESTALTGTFRFHLIIRAPIEVDGSGRLTAKAVVAQRSFFIFKGEAPAGEPASLTFTLRRDG